MIEIRSFGKFSEKFECFHRTSLLCQILQLQLFNFHEVMGISGKALKENELLGGCGLIVSYAFQV